MTKEEMIGKAYNSFTDEEKAKINKMITGTYYGTFHGIEITPSILENGEYPIIINLDNGLSVEGTTVITDNETIETIDETGTFYDPTE